MDQVKRIENRDVLYKADINQPPYVIANYPPLYMYWVAAANTILKLPLFQAGRFISLLFSILTGSMIGLFSYRLTANRWYGILGAVLFWGHPYVMIWSSLARVDLMALGFSLLGLWILYRYKDSWIGISLACLCFLASIYTRQTYILAGPLAGFIWLWHHSRKHALIFLLSLAGSGLLIFGTINAITHGGFYTNIVVANINLYSLNQTISMMLELVRIWPLILLTSLILVILALYTRIKKSEDVKDQTLAQSFVVYGLIPYTIGALVSAATVGKIGSNVNYFLELIAVCAVWCTVGLKYLVDKKPVFRYAYLGILFIQLAWVLGYSFLVSQVNTGDMWKSIDKYRSLDQLVKNATGSGPVLSDDFMDMIVLSGQPIYYQPFEYGELYYAGLWNPTPLVDQINQREFPLIIVGGTSLNKNCCWPPPVITALEANYQIQAQNDVLLLTPRK